jgi:hypothetical protein
VDLIEKDQREAREAQARSDEARTRIAQVMAAPNRKTCDERDVVELHVDAGFIAPEDLEQRGAAYKFPDGRKVFVLGRVLGLRWPSQSCPGWHVLQADDVSDVPYSLASRPAPAVTPEDYNLLVRRLPIDTSARPFAWGLNGATRRMLEARLETHWVKARGPLRQHEIALWVRNGGRPDVTARAIYNFEKRRAYEAAVAREMTNPPGHRDEVAEREIPGLYETLLADAVRAAGPGVIPWGAAVVTVVDELGDVAGALFDKVRGFLATRAEPVTSAELASVLGVREDAADLHQACEAAGFRKVRKSVDGSRERVWVRS